MFKRYLIFALTALLLVGCNTRFVVDSVELVGRLQLLDSQYEQTVAMVTANKLRFSDDEWVQLTTVNEHVKQLRVAAHLLIAESGGLAQALINVEQVRTLGQLAELSYGAARRVFCPGILPGEAVMLGRCERLASIPPLDAVALIDFDRTAVQVRAMLRDVLASPEGSNITEALGDVLTIGATAARLARLGAG